MCIDIQSLIMCQKKKTNKINKQTKHTNKQQKRKSYHSTAKNNLEMKEKPPLHQVLNSKFCIFSFWVQSILFQAQGQGKESYVFPPCPLTIYNVCFILHLVQLYAISNGVLTEYLNYFGLASSVFCFLFFLKQIFATLIILLQGKNMRKVTAKKIPHITKILIFFLLKIFHLAAWILNFSLDKYKPKSVNGGSCLG